MYMNTPVYILRLLYFYEEARLLKVNLFSYHEQEALTIDADTNQPYM